TRRGRRRATIRDVAVAGTALPADRRQRRGDGRGRARRDEQRRGFRGDDRHRCSTDEYPHGPEGRSPSGPDLPPDRGPRPRPLRRGEGWGQGPATDASEIAPASGSTNATAPSPPPSLRSTGEKERIDYDPHTDADSATALGRFRQSQRLAPRARAGWVRGVALRCEQRRRQAARGRGAARGVGARSGVPAEVRVVPP